MKLCRFKSASQQTQIGVLEENGQILELNPGQPILFSEILNADDPVACVRRLAATSDTRHSLEEIELLPPLDEQEVWAAGVTYLRSKTARMEESDFSASAYDRVYEAERPEIFFKSLPAKVVGHREAVGIRKDGKWNVPEPELALVINSRGSIVGYSIGNDMSSRDIEGENLLYLPQAKVYARSCAIGPCIVLGVTEQEVRDWTISISIARSGNTVFSGNTSVSQIKRGFCELAEFLTRSQEFPHGAVLLTGTGIVPPDDFTLAENDQIDITISGIGQLSNHVVRV